MSTSDDLQEKALDAMEVERRAQFGRIMAKSIYTLMTIGILIVLGIWLAAPAYTQFLWYAFLLVPPVVIALLHHVFESRGHVTLWTVLFVGSTTSIAFFVPFLVPDVLLAMTIGYVLVFLLCGLLLGSKYVLWMIVFCVPALVSNIVIGHRIEDSWFLSLDPTTSAIVAPSVGGFLLLVAAVIVYVILNGQEKLYRQAQLATMESQQARAAAEQANLAKSHLLAKVSHELRTPLGGVLGYAELLRDNSFGLLNEQQKEAASEIVQSANYLSSMVNELLDEAQIEAKSLVLQKRRFSTAVFFQQTTASLAVLARNKGLAFVAVISPDLPEEIYGDDYRLRQILINLVGNAVKFTKEGEVRVNVLYPDPAHWVLQVSDTGMGIPQESQSYIFEPFRQADNALTSENRGVGLGLSITRQLVELMGGKITLDSEVGRGTTFNVVLPLEP